jgi:hypothetical protein
MPGFEYTYENKGRWVEIKKSVINKIFYIKSDESDNILPIESNFSSVGISERELIFKSVKKLPPKSKILDVEASLGGRSAIMAKANKTANIIAIESFDGLQVKSDFESMSNWIREQLIDNCKQLNQNKSIGIELLEAVKNSFIIDESGKLAFEIINKKYSNITLIDKFDSEIETLDLCLLKNKMDNITYWSKYIKNHGYMIIYPYFEKQSPLEHWELIDSKGLMILIQKKFKL